MQPPRERAQRFAASLAPHPYTQQLRRLRRLAVLMLAMGLLMAWLGLFAMTFICIAVVVWFGWMLRGAPGALRGAQLHNAAVERTLAGDFDMAEALIEVAEVEARTVYLKRASHTHRTLLSLYRGDLDTAVTAATAAVEGPTRLRTRQAELNLIGGALALRALAYAMRGDDTLALEDAKRVREHEAITPASFGRALLAEMIVANHRGDLGALRELCRGSVSSPAVAELPPRERSLYRAYRALAFASSRGVYREPPENHKLFEEQFFGAEPHVEPEPELRAAPPASAAATDTQKVSAEQRQHKGRVRRRMLGLYVGVLASVGLVFWLMSAVSDGGGSVEGELASGGVTVIQHLPIALGLVLVAFFVGRAMLVRRDVRRARAINRHLALGELGLARQKLEQQHKGPFLAHRADAGSGLAQLAFDEARFAATVELTTHATGSLEAQPALAAAYADLLLPGLRELRAAALAAQGQHEAARAELANLLAACPSYAFRQRAVHRVELLCAVTARDWERAREIAKARPAQAPIGLREEMLGDLVLLQEAASDDERKRLAAELELPELRRWIEALAPELAVLSQPQRLDTGANAEPESLADEEEEEAQRAQATVR